MASLLQLSGGSHLVKVLRKNYLKFTASEAGTFRFSKEGLSYSLDSGSTWTSIDANTATPTVAAGSSILWKGQQIPTTNSSGASNGIGYFSSTGNFVAEGNPMCLMFGDDFDGKVDLTGKSFAFNYLFGNCSKLTSIENLVLPATTLASSCYNGMFNGCTSLTTVPIDLLPATTLASSCYNGMFNGCTSLTTVPELPATTLVNQCYYGMFKSCDSLYSLSSYILPATTLAENCYQNMFSGCASLTSAPQMLATSLAPYCCYGMFSGCPLLITPPELPVTTLAEYCYYSMFSSCTSLTSTPILPAETLADFCYTYMFNGCTSLNYVKCLAISLSATSCTLGWLNGVASSGTFIKADSMTSWTTGNSGIPTNWVVPEYFKIIANEAGTFQFSKAGLSYSLNDGVTWTSLSASTNTPTISAGNSIWLKGTLTPTSSGGIGTFSSTGKFKISGNVMSLLFGDNHYGQNSLSGKSYAFYGLFRNCTGLTNAQDLLLPATTLATYCYYYMFSGCANLESVPSKLPATTLAGSCYRGMFYNCSSLVTAPELPAPTLANGCYYYLFNGCSKLNYIKCLATNISASNSRNNWVVGVASMGTFVKATSMTSWTTGNSGIPSGWTVTTA